MLKLVRHCDRLDALAFVEHSSKVKSALFTKENWCFSFFKVEKEANRFSLVAFLFPQKYLDLLDGRALHREEELVVFWRFWPFKSILNGVCPNLPSGR